MTDEIEAAVEHEPEAVMEPEPMSAEQRLRAFEDEHMGEDVPRIDGKVERGHGSKYHLMKPHHRAHHAALEKLVEAEKHMMHTAAEHAKAVTAHAEAMKVADHHAHAE